MPDTDCPVCRRPGETVAICPCGWELNTPYRLGTPTEADLRDFDAGLARAQRRLDLTAAARVASRDGALDRALLGEVAAFARGGPPSRDELRDLAAEVPPPGEAAVPAAGETVAEIDAYGVSVPGYVTDSGGTRFERADLAQWTWPALLPGLSADPAERAFQLAGGVGLRPLAPAEVAESLAAGLPRQLAGAGAPLLLRCHAPGWAVPEAAAALLAERHPGARTVQAAAPDRGALVIRAAEVVTAFAGAVDGWLAAGDGGGTVTLWAAGSAAPAGHRNRVAVGRVTTVDLLPGGTGVVSGHRDGSVRLWSRAGGEVDRLLTRHTEGWVNAVRVCGDVVFSLGDDGMLRRTPIVPGGGAQLRIDVGYAAATALAARPDGGLVAVGGADRRVRLWDGRTGSPLATVATGVPVTALALGPALIVGGADGSVRWHHPDRTGAPPVVTEFGGAAVRCVAARPDGLVVAGDEAGAVRTWTGGSPGAVPHPVGMHDGTVRGLAAVTGGRWASAGTDGLIRVWGRAAAPGSE